MGIGQGLPVFDDSDRALFSLEDPRRRADSLRDLLVPKIRAMHRSLWADSVRSTEAIPMKDRVGIHPSARIKEKTP